MARMMVGMVTASAIMKGSVELLLTTIVVVEVVLVVKTVVLTP